MSRVIKARQVATEVLQVSHMGAETGEGALLTSQSSLGPASGMHQGDSKNGAVDAQVAAEYFHEVKREARKLLLHSQRIVERRLAELATKEASVGQVVEDAREAGRHEGYEAGYREGYDQGRHDALEEYRQLIEAAQTTLDEAKRSQWLMQQQAEEDLVKLAVAIAEKLIRQALHTDEAAAVAILHGMLAKVDGSSTARVRVPRELYDKLQQESSSFAALTPGGCTLEFHPDDTLRMGDVVIETDWGLIDGRLQSRWQRIIQGLDLTELSADDAT